MKTYLRLGLVLAIAACSDEPAPRLDQPGDPCRTQAINCLDDESARVCIDGILVDRDCEDICRERGPALMSAGCQSSEMDECVCEPLPGYCLPGATMCESETELALCNGAQVWEVHACEDVCAASLGTPVSLGCEDPDDEDAACWCEAG